MIFIHQDIIREQMHMQNHHLIETYVLVMRVVVVVVVMLMMMMMIIQATTITEQLKQNLKLLYPFSLRGIFEVRRRDIITLRKSF